MQWMYSMGGQRVVLIGCPDQGTLFSRICTAKDTQAQTSPWPSKRANQQRSFIRAIMKSNHNLHCCMLCVSPTRSIKCVILLLGVVWKESSWDRWAGAVTYTHTHTHTHTHTQLHQQFGLRIIMRSNKYAQTQTHTHKEGWQKSANFITC